MNAGVESCERRQITEYTKLAKYVDIIPRRLSLLGVLGVAGLAGFFDQRFFALSSLSFLSYIAYFRFFSALLDRRIFILKERILKERMPIFIASLVPILIYGYVIPMFGHKLLFLGFLGFLGYLGFTLDKPSDVNPKKE